jgi:hypothetical protein
MKREEFRTECRKVSCKEDFNKNCGLLEDVSDADMANAVTLLKLGSRITSIEYSLHLIDKITVKAKIQKSDVLGCFGLYYGLIESVK